MYSSAQFEQDQFISAVPFSIMLFLPFLPHKHISTRLSWLLAAEERPYCRFVGGLKGGTFSLTSPGASWPFENLSASPTATLLTRQRRAWQTAGATWGRELWTPQPLQRWEPPFSQVQAETAGMALEELLDLERRQYSGGRTRRCF